MKLTRLEDGRVFDIAPHQREALNHLQDNPRAALFLGMSLQKTVITLLYLSEMIYAEAAFSRTLVIAPDKVARLTWPDEVAKWEETKHVRYSLIAGTAKQRLAALNVDADVYIIGEANVVWLCDLYVSQAVSKVTGRNYGPWRGKLPFDSLVIDELSLFKGRSSQRFIKLRRAITGIEYRIGLTGTPSPNGLIDLWAQVFLLDDGARLGETFAKFVDKYFTTRGNGMIVFEYIPKAGTQKVIAHKLADLALSMQTRDKMELPPLEFIDEEIELNPYDAEIYETLEREYCLDFFEGDEVTVKTPADLVNKLLQITSGAVYADAEEGKAKTWHEVSTAKLDALEDLVNEFGDETFIVVYQFRHEVDRVKARFPEAVELPKGRKLKETFDAWNAGSIKMLILHPASAGHGLNLQFGGRRMVWFTPTWNLEHFEQTVARLLRTGATRKIYIHRLLVKGSRDFQVKKRVTAKGSNQSFLLDEIKHLRNKYGK